jgi:hypothetical protein
MENKYHALYLLPLILHACEQSALRPLSPHMRLTYSAAAPPPTTSPPTMSPPAHPHCHVGRRRGSRGPRVARWRAMSRAACWWGMLTRCPAACPHTRLHLPAVVIGALSSPARSSWPQHELCLGVSVCPIRAGATSVTPSDNDGACKSSASIRSSSG